MSTTVQLPSSLRQRIVSLAQRIRLLRGVRGLSLLVLVLGLTAAAAMTADFLLDGALPDTIRRINITVWSGIGLTLLLVGLILPLLRRLDSADLAAAIEEKYPELGERLTSSVELCEHPDPGNGSPALIELLVRETEARTNPLDFKSAISSQGTTALGIVAAALLVPRPHPGRGFPPPVRPVPQPLPDAQADTWRPAPRHHQRAARRHLRRQGPAARPVSRSHPAPPQDRVAQDQHACGDQPRWRGNPARDAWRVGQPLDLFRQPPGAQRFFLSRRGRQLLQRYPRGEVDHARRSDRREPDHHRHATPVRQQHPRGRNAHGAGRSHRPEAQSDHLRLPVQSTRCLRRPRIDRRIEEGRRHHNSQAETVSRSNQRRTDHSGSRFGRLPGHHGRRARHHHRARRRHDHRDGRFAACPPPVHSERDGPSGPGVRPSGHGSQAVG